METNHDLVRTGEVSSTGGIAVSDSVSETRGSQIIALPQNVSRGEAINVLSRNIPLNEFGLPVYFYRSDLLPFQAGYLTQDDVDSAAIGLFYHDGFPQLNTGQSFWNQLPHEPYQAYLLFTRYLEQAEELGIRQLDLLSSSTGEDLPLLQQQYHEFYWSARARAYDLFLVAAEQKKREIRIRKMENEHFDKTKGLFDKLMAKFAEDDDWTEDLNAKEAIEVLETLVKLQRLSVGLTGQHASSNPRDPLPPGANAELIIRQLTRGAGLSEQTADNFQNKLTHLLGDPEQGAVLQEMILRVNTTQFQQDGRVSGQQGAGFDD